MYFWVVFIHLVGVFGFLLAHGASVGISFRLPHEEDPRAVRVLLDLAAAMRGVMYGSLALLGVGGIVSGIMGGWWSRGWTWASVGVLILMVGGIAGVGARYFRRLRQVAEVATKDESALPELRALQTAPQPWIVTSVGIGGLVVLLWLMVLKPF